MRSPTELNDAFRARGLKITPQRQLIFRLLHDNVTHPTAEAVYAAAVAEMPAISLRTVYQTLNDLSAMGEIQTLDLGTGSARFDPLVAEHHHMVCDHCAAVYDVEVLGTARLAPVGAPDGFTVTSTELVMRGLCAGCAPTAGRDAVPPATEITSRRHRG